MALKMTKEFEVCRNEMIRRIFAHLQLCKEMLEISGVPLDGPVDSSSGLVPDNHTSDANLVHLEEAAFLMHYDAPGSIEKCQGLAQAVIQNLAQLRDVLRTYEHLGNKLEEESND